MKWHTLALMILFGVAVLQVLIFYPKCPDVMVSQVGPQGQPTGRMTKPVFFAVSLGSTLFAGGVTMCRRSGFSRSSISSRSEYPRSIEN